MAYNNEIVGSLRQPEAFGPICHAFTLTSIYVKFAKRYMILPRKNSTNTAA